jgi:hypothetical protein
MRHGRLGTSRNLRRLTRSVFSHRSCARRASIVTVTVARGTKRTTRRVTATKNIFTTSTRTRFVSGTAVGRRSEAIFETGSLITRNQVSLVLALLTP